MSRETLHRRFYSGYFLAVLAMAGLATAEVSVRECIMSPPAGQAMRVLPGGDWHDLASLTLSNATASDYVVSAMVDVPKLTSPGPNPSGALVQYQLLLDGVAKYWVTRRTPIRPPSTQTFRASIPDVPAGTHTITIRASNLTHYEGVG